MTFVAGIDKAKVKKKIKEADLDDETKEVMLRRLEISSKIVTILKKSTAEQPEAITILSSLIASLIVQANDPLEVFGISILQLADIFREVYERKSDLIDEAKAEEEE